MVHKGVPEVEEIVAEQHSFKKNKVTRDWASIITKYKKVFVEDLTGGRCLCGKMKIHL